VQAELASKGFNEAQQNLIENYLNISGTNKEKLAKLASIFSGNETAAKGIEEINFVLNYHEATGMAQFVETDFTLARGLNYYTGIIFEVKAIDTQMGSIGGGGRYDDLTGLFGVKGIAGVGISFGVDRIYDVMEELSVFPENIQRGTTALLFHTGEAQVQALLSLSETLRNEGISCELYHEQVKFDKQFKYAEKKGIPYVIILGSEELQKGTIVVKHLASGKQEELNTSALINLLKD